MVTGGNGSSDEIARAAHNEEQECFFYVAMSRARERLAFYGATAKSNGTSRPLSMFLDRIGAVSRRQVMPLTVLPPAPDVAQIPVVFSGTPRFSSEAVALYESCGRRFLYTHLLKVGGRRRMSAFMLMHEAIREVYRKVVAQGTASTGQLRRFSQTRSLPMGFTTTATSRTTVPWPPRCWATSWSPGRRPG